MVLSLELRIDFFENGVLNDEMTKILFGQKEAEINTNTELYGYSVYKNIFVFLSIHTF